MERKRPKEEGYRQVGIKAMNSDTVLSELKSVMSEKLSQTSEEKSGEQLDESSETEKKVNCIMLINFGACQ